MIQSFALRRRVQSRDNIPWDLNSDDFFICMGEQVWINLLPGCRELRRLILVEKNKDFGSQLEKETGV